MATTTNFGWETPDDTDLVKDGAAAMRTLGNSIDTSFVDLKGGTTGQILSKASNTDLDYTWITNDMGDITAVTAGTGLTGGGTSGSVTLSVDTATVLTTNNNVLVENKILLSPEERTTVSATAATGTINYDAKTQSVLFYTTNASANWTLNIRGNGSTTLSSMLAVGDAITVTFLVQQGSTAYYPTALQIDGSAVTPKYQGGTAWTAGNASSIDAYVYTVIKTAVTPTYTVFASQTKFA